MPREPLLLDAATQTQVTALLKQRNQAKSLVKPKLDALDKFLAKKILSLPRVELSQDEIDDTNSEYESMLFQCEDHSQLSGTSSL